MWPNRLSKLILRLTLDFINNQYQTLTHPKQQKYLLPRLAFGQLCCLHISNVPETRSDLRGLLELRVEWLQVHWLEHGRLGRHHGIWVLLIL